MEKKLEDINENSSTSNLGITVNSLFNDIEEKGPDYINDQLALIEVSKGNPAHLVAVLNTLFTWRNIVSNWKPFRVRMLAEFKDRKIENIESSLKGLL